MNHGGGRLALKTIETRASRATTSHPELLLRRPTRPVVLKRIQHDGNVGWIRAWLFYAFMKRVARQQELNPNSEYLLSPIEMFLVHGLLVRLIPDGSTPAPRSTHEVLDHHFLGRETLTFYHDRVDRRVGWKKCRMRTRTRVVSM